MGLYAEFIGASQIRGGSSSRFTVNSPSTAAMLPCTDFSARSTISRSTDKIPPSDIDSPVARIKYVAAGCFIKSFKSIDCSIQSSAGLGNPAGQCVPNSGSFTGWPGENKYNFDVFIIGIIYLYIYTVDHKRNARGRKPETKPPCKMRRNLIIF